MNICRFLYISLQICIKSVYYFFKMLWFLSYLCSFQGIMYLSLCIFSLNRAISSMNFFLEPIYNYLQIQNNFSVREILIVYPLCSVIHCDHPSIYFSQMILGWKPVNQTFVSEFIDIDFMKLSQTFGESLGRGIVYQMRSDMKSYIMNIFQNNDYSNTYNYLSD